MADLAVVVSPDNAWTQIPGVAGKNFQFTNLGASPVQVVTMTGATAPLATHHGGIIIPSLQWNIQPMTFAAGETGWFRSTGFGTGTVQPVEVV